MSDIGDNERTIEELAELRPKYGALASGTAQDKQQSIEELKQSEDRFRTLAEAAFEGIAITEDGVLLDANRQLCCMTGYTVDELRGMCVADLVAPEDRELVRCNQGEGYEMPYESRLLCKDGSLMTIETRARHYTLRGKKIRVTVLRDITESRKAEEALRKTTARLKEAQAIAHVGSWEYDLRSNILWWSEELCRIFSLDPGERPFSLEQFLARVHPEDRERLKSQILAALPYRSDYRIVLPDGKRRTIHEEVRVEYDFQGRPVLFRGTAQDITERQKMEDELKDYRDHLEELVSRRAREITALSDQLRQSQKLEAVGILAGGIAHEFNNILTTIKASMYLAQKKLPEESPVMKYAEQVLGSIKKANALSQGLLTFSRKQTITLRPVHFNEIIRNVGKMLTRLIGEDIELIMKLTDKDPTVMADMNQIEQILVNLATNASDAMPDGGRLTIDTEVIRMDEVFKKQHGYGIPGEYVVLTVADNGVGIEEAIKGKIFEPFFTTKVVGKGSGLGLAVTYGIVKQHNGFVDVESAPGEGTTFKIYFPTEEAEVIQPADQDKRFATGGAETVLLAEDDEDARATMSEMLRMTGYTVLEARDGEEAIMLFIENKNSVHLVFLDVRMPKKNGKAVYREIKSIHPRTKFLFISGYTSDIMNSFGVSETGVNFISKVASPDEILRKIREVLDQ